MLPQAALVIPDEGRFALHPHLPSPCTFESRGEHERRPTVALADRVKNPTPALHGLPCSIGVLLDSLDGPELDALKHMLKSDSGWSQAMIWKALADEGYVVGQQSVNRHRAGSCRCAK